MKKSNDYRDLIDYSAPTTRDLVFSAFRAIARDFGITTVQIDMAYANDGRAAFRHRLDTLMSVAFHFDSTEHRFSLKFFHFHRHSYAKIPAKPYAELNVTDESLEDAIGFTHNVLRNRLVAAGFVNDRIPTEQMNVFWRSVDEEKWRAPLFCECESIVGDNDGEPCALATIPGLRYQGRVVYVCRECRPDIEELIEEERLEEEEEREMERLAQEADDDDDDDVCGACGKHDCEGPCPTCGAMPKYSNDGDGESGPAPGGYLYHACDCSAGGVQ